MKEILDQYAAFNLWANQRMIDTIFLLSKEETATAINSSFSSIDNTLAHMWEAESIWWQRIKLSETIVHPSLAINTREDLAAGLLKQSKQWEEWIVNSTVAALEHEFFYRNSKKEQFKQHVYEVLMHLFNHQTYHRGQLIIMFQQLSVQNIPATDFIEFIRRKK